MRVAGRGVTDALGDSQSTVARLALLVHTSICNWIAKFFWGGGWGGWGPCGWRGDDGFGVGLSGGGGWGICAISGRLVTVWAVGGRYG
ncbi:hypothetical protein DZC75_01300 [Pseudomonas parafulva]|uniref:Uncharacterized protein n=1 Tax=Pseudomonas parafulva TaxID=157782 RepID=A0AAI8K7U3_9PSED|nr:hypothetical protein DZC75_01300 [Pseudomonas parafulva]